MDSLDSIADDEERRIRIQSFRDVGFTWTNIAKILEVSTKSLYRWRIRTGFDTDVKNIAVGKKSYMKQHL